MSDKLKNILEWIECIVIAIVLALLIRYYVGTPTVVQMDSMYPTLKQGERLVLNRIPRTRIDLVLVDTIPNEQGMNDIYLAELKVGTVATEGTSGTIDHVEKTFRLINTEKACQDLKEDVTNIINVKSKLGIYTGTAKQFNLADKPKMMLILAYRGEEEYKRLLKDSTAAQEKAKELGMDEIKVVMHNALIKLD